MSGYDDLALGLSGMSELGQDDPRVHNALQSAIDSGDLEDEDAGLAYSALGSCWHAIGEQTKARNVLTKAIRLSEDPARLALTHHELGETYFAMEKEDQAEEHFRKSLASDRQHNFAPDTLLLLGRVVYMRVEQEDDLQLVEECYGFFDEAVAMLESPDSAKYGDFFSRSKTLFDLYTSKATCKAVMPSDNERFEAARYFEQAEQIALEHPETITRQELQNVYLDWAELYKGMGLEREVELVLDRVKRNLD